MTRDHSMTGDRAPDAGDVVEGPIGSARIKDPSPSGPSGVDLEALAAIDVPPDDRAEKRRSTHVAAEAREPKR